MVVSIQEGRAEHIFDLCEQICLNEHGEDWYDESHLINVSVWLSVSGPEGGLYKWASYYRGRICRLIQFCDRGLKKNHLVTIFESTVSSSSTILVLFLPSHIYV